MGMERQIGAPGVDVCVVFFNAYFAVCRVLQPFLPVLEDALGDKDIVSKLGFDGVKRKRKANRCFPLDSIPVDGA